MKIIYITLAVFLTYSFGFLSAQQDSTKRLLDSSRILLFYGTTYDDHQTFELTSAENIFSHKNFDNSRKTVFYIHGFEQRIDDENIKTTVATYQQRIDYNILILDWTAIARGDYVFQVLPDTVTFSKILTDVFLRLFGKGLQIEKLHVLSHSLGSQLAGMVGREIQKQSGGKLILKRITCLDPAFPGFYPPIPLLQHVNKNDAEFVDVIHTDTGFYGTPFSTGTVDFWVNGLTLRQPGCPPRSFKLLDPDDLCSHWRSWRFWTESVTRNSSRFLSQKCKSFLFFYQRDCDTNNLVTMGINCPSGITGNYYLETRAESPYSY